MGSNLNLIFFIITFHQYHIDSNPNFRSVETPVNPLPPVYILHVECNEKFSGLVDFIKLPDAIFVIHPS